MDHTRLVVDLLTYDLSPCSSLCERCRAALYGDAPSRFVSLWTLSCIELWLYATSIACPSVKFQVFLMVS